MKKDGLEEIYDPLFLVLGARALQRNGDGFPSTDQEISEFEKNCEVTEDDRQHFKKVLMLMIEKAFKD